MSRAADSGISNHEFSVAPVWNSAVTQTISNIPLREFLLKALPKGTSFFLDRRIDPSISISVSFDNISFLKGFDSVLREKGLEIFVLDKVLYIGPEDSAGTLALLRDLNRAQLINADKGLKFALQKKSSLDVPFAASSRDILTRLAEKGNFEWVDLNRFPFDCWNEMKLTSLPLIDQVTLILVGFDCRMEADQEKGKFRFVRNKPSDSVKLVLSKNKAQNIDPDLLLKFLRKETQKSAGEVEMSGTFTDLVRLMSKLIRTQKEIYFNSSKAIARDFDSSKNKKIFGKTKVVSGEIKNVSLEQLFSHLQKSLDVVFLLDPVLSQKGITVQTRITCFFDKADSDTAAEIISKKLKIQYRQENGSVLFY